MLTVSVILFFIFFKSLVNPPLFVFVTDNASFAIEGYELGLLDYILKPICFSRLLKTITKAQVHLDLRRKNSLPTNDFLVIKDRANIVIIPYGEIFYIKSDKDYVWVDTLSRKYHTWERLGHLEEALISVNQFVRVHKSYIVNLDFAQRVEGNFIKLKGNVIDVPIGGLYKAKLFRRLGLSM